MVRATSAVSAPRPCRAASPRQPLPRNGGNLRRLLLSLALALTLSAVGASSALAEAPEGAQKAPLYGPNAFGGFSCEAGVFPTPQTFGFVVLNTPGNETKVSGELAVKHAAPNHNYLTLFIRQATGAACTFSETSRTVVTNAQGNANLHFTFERVPAATKFWVGIGEPPGETIGSAAIELD